MYTQTLLTIINTFPYKKGITFISISKKVGQRLHASVNFCGIVQYIKYTVRIAWTCTNSFVEKAH